MFKLAIVCSAIVFSVGTIFIPHLAHGQGATEKPREPAGVKIVDVATNEAQWTGVAVSRNGRVFVNFPRWNPEVPVSVGELKANGSVVPYPNETLNGWTSDKDAGEKFVCVQSVYVDRKDRLWILDPANPMFRGVVEGGAKLIEVDLESNKIVRAIPFDDAIAPERSYLNDVRVDTRAETAYITDSGMGALVVVDLVDGSARRVLGDHASTKAEKTTITIGGRPVPVVVHSDGIALDQEGGWLYYQALTGRTLYRVPTAALSDETLSAEQLESRVAAFAQSGISDGLLYAHGGVYVSALEDGAIKRVDANGRVVTLVKDDRIVWPDSFALGPDGSVWFTTSQIHLGPTPPTPYRILKIPANR